MSLKNHKASSTTLVYIIIAMLILILVLIFGGADWFRGTHINRSFGYSNWDWTQILISLAIGIVIGWFLHKKRR